MRDTPIVQPILPHEDLLPSEDLIPDEMPSENQPALTQGPRSGGQQAKVGGRKTPRGALSRGGFAV